MKLDIITIFPTIFDSLLEFSMLKRAQEKKIVTINTINLRDFAHDQHRSVDDRPYGGGPGMVMKPEPFFEAVDSIGSEGQHVVLLSPQGVVFNQKKAQELSQYSHLIFLCGHYEGVDERVRLGLVDEEISLGDYILTSGNIAAMIVIDSVVRLLPGVLGCDQSIKDESFSQGLLEYPQYTRPRSYRNMQVPDILLSGDHGSLNKWRLEQAIHRTKERRPDLFRLLEPED